MLIEKIISYLEVMNPSKNLPYHSNKHMIGVMEIALRLLHEEVLSNSIHIASSELVHQRDILIAATLFHDFGHSGGKLTDRENIDLAVEGLYEFNGLTEEFEAMEMVEIASAIECTEFPFIKNPTTLVEKCIRDADLLYSCLSRDPEIILTGLRTEMGVISRTTMCEGQMEFIERVTMFTEAGQKLWDLRKDEFLKEVKDAAGYPDLGELK